MIQKEIKNPPKMLPILYQPELGGLTPSYQEKSGNKWLIKDPSQLSKIIDISNKQVYHHHRQKIFLEEPAKNTVVKYLLKDHTYPLLKLDQVKNGQGDNLDPKKYQTIFDCGNNYFLDPSTNLVYNQEKQIGVYTHDPDCPNCNDHTQKCWYYLVKN